MNLTIRLFARSIDPNTTDHLLLPPLGTAPLSSRPLRPRDDTWRTLSSHQRYSQFAHRSFQLVESTERWQLRAYKLVVSPLLVQVHPGDEFTAAAGLDGDCVSLNARTRMTLHHVAVIRVAQEDGSWSWIAPVQRLSLHARPSSCHGTVVYDEGRLCPRHESAAPPLSCLGPHSYEVSTSSRCGGVEVSVAEESRVLISRERTNRAGERKLPCLAMKDRDSLQG